MTAPFTSPRIGTYAYVYPTFADKPQLLCIHFLTPDQQKAFVTYPNRKVAQLVPVSWFNSVNMVQLEEQSELVHFLEVTLCRWLQSSKADLVSVERPLYQPDAYATCPVLTA